MKIGRLFDPVKLFEHVSNGNISVRKHPTLPLRIYNYTKQCQYNRVWDEVTLRCRGLIVDDQNNVIGQGFSKFFNYGEVEIDTGGPVQVTDKADGSLIIICKYNGQLVTATRGSFESDQAIAANKIVHDKYYDDLMSYLSWETESFLFEYISPDNRIVLDYGDMQDLILIGSISHDTIYGKQLWLPASEIEWQGPKVEEFNVNSFAEALSFSPRNNAEGIVVYFENTGERLKIKQQDYVELHRLIFNLNQKYIWEQLQSGKSVDELCMSVPDELYDYVKTHADYIIYEYNEIINGIPIIFNFIKNQIDISDRKAFAEHVKNNYNVKVHSALFLMLDNQYSRLIEWAWKAVKPKG